MRGASLSSLPVASCGSGRASLRTVNERSSGDLLFVCYTSLRTAHIG
nr:MAG TPA: hypothetical protein [Caudoviricetes sp.]